MFKVLVADKLAQAGLDILQAAKGIEIETASGLKPPELAARIAPFHGLIIRSGSTVTAEVIAAAENLRVIGRAGIGVDNVDVPAATARGIVVMNTPSGNNVTTAEHAISMMLSLARSIPQATASMKGGKWEKNRFVGAEVFNKTLGVIGLGNIGSLVAERAFGLKMKVVVYDPFLSEEVAHKHGVELLGLDELYARADFITIHVPLMPETRGLVGAAAFAKMKKGVRLVNCARGGIVDEAALAAAIQAGTVAGAALDVFAEEPPPADHPLLQMDQVICTPHLGAATDEAQLNVATAIAQQVVNFLEHEVIEDAVNVPSISPEQRLALRPYLTLAAKLGSLQGQLLEGAPTEVSIDYAGDVASLDKRPLTVAVLHGMLNHVAASSVNFVNAPAVAKDRGIKVIEATTTESKTFSNHITVRVRTKQGSNVVSGAIFGQDIIRLVRINDFFVDSRPEGHILMLHNRDVPGVVGAVGALLAEAQVNIARLELGRDEVGGNAVSLIHVDGVIPDDVIERMRTLPNIVSAELIYL